MIIRFQASVADDISFLISRVYLLLVTSYTKKLAVAKNPINTVKLAKLPKLAGEIIGLKGTKSAMLQFFP